MTKKKKSFLPDFDHPEVVEQPDEKQREKLRKKYIRKLRWQKILTVFMVLIVAIYLVGGVYAVRYANKLLKGMPTLNVDDLISTESSKIYDGNGTLLTEIGTYYRENIAYEQMPESLIDAFLSAKNVEGCSKRTILYYKSTIENMLIYMRGHNKALPEVNTSDIRKYITDYSDSHSANKTTLDNIRRIISSLFSWLEEENYIENMWNEYQITLNNIDIAEYEEYYIEKGLQTRDIEGNIISFDIIKAKKMVRDLKSSIKDLGEVDTSIIKEYLNTKERYDYLLNQREDLESSKKSLEKIIREIAFAMEEQFVSRMDIINKNFKEIFVTLFGGRKC